MPQPAPRKALGKRGAGCTIRSNGKLYLVDMAEMWQDLMPDLTFSQLKRAFFKNELFEVDGTHVSPRRRLTIKFNASFEETLNTFEEYVKCIDATLMGFKGGGKAFSKQEFVNVFMSHVGEGFTHKDGVGSVFEFFVSNQTFRGENSRINDPVECVFQRRVSGRLETQYLITQQTFVSTKGTLMRDASNCAPNMSGDTYEVYLAEGKHATGSHELRFACLVQLLGLGTYEITGGEDPQMFVRMNKPLDIKRFSENTGYRNAVLTDMHNRKKRAADIMTGFFLADLTDEERWNVIEDYFLDDIPSVKHALGLDTNEG